jgi:alkylhydroperoxidase family enzyme
LRLDQGSIEQRRRLPSIHERALTDLAAQNVCEYEAEEDDRNEARERELSEEADPRPQWRAETVHLGVLAPSRSARSPAG